METKKKTVIMKNGLDRFELSEGDRVIVRKCRSQGPDLLKVAIVSRIMGTTRQWLQVERFGEFNLDCYRRSRDYSSDAGSIREFDQKVLDDNAEAHRVYNEEQELRRRIAALSFERALHFPELRTLLLTLVEGLEAKAAK